MVEVDTKSGLGFRKSSVKSVSVLTLTKFSSWTISEIYASVHEHTTIGIQLKINGCHHFACIYRNYKCVVVDDWMIIEVNMCAYVYTWPDLKQRPFEASHSLDHWAKAKH